MESSQRLDSSSPARGWPVHPQRSMFSGSLVSRVGVSWLLFERWLRGNIAWAVSSTDQPDSMKRRASWSRVRDASACRLETVSRGGVRTMRSRMMCCQWVHHTAGERIGFVGVARHIEGSAAVVERWRSSPAMGRLENGAAFLAADVYVSRTKTWADDDCALSTAMAPAVRRRRESGAHGFGVLA